MLVQVALIAVALCGMLSLIIDVGYARVTQGQMQNAAFGAPHQARVRLVQATTPVGPLDRLGRSGR